jgi:hypothetical protein
MKFYKLNTSGNLYTLFCFGDKYMEFLEGRSIMSYIMYEVVENHYPSHKMVPITPLEARTAISDTFKVDDPLEPFKTSDITPADYLLLKKYLK